ncbi:MAG: Capsule biosynthesis protein CapA [Syntrophus sp. PtaB.Bin001]|nr:MAG: Capsule biosynthesis protein CapA [Syntrophus sp. PtaB.Bin001]
MLELLQKAPLCVVNLANNHIMDFGPEALERTLALLKEKVIHAIGAGRTISQARQELILSCKGKRIAFLAFTSDEPHVKAVIAGPDTPGCASFSDFNEVLRRVRSAKSQADIVCVSLHWGYEFHSFPAPEQVALAHQIAEAGATYIIGHHPHVLQGVETFKKSLIMYSLGNFFFPSLLSINGRLQPSKAISREYMILKSEIDDSLNIKSVIKGGRVSANYGIVSYSGAKLRQFEKKIQFLSAPLSGQDYGSFWINYKNQRSRELLKESMMEALHKLWFMPKGELLRTIRLSDFRRNFIRLYRILHK